jgi:hypothetical protein
MYDTRCFCRAEDPREWTSVCLVKAVDGLYILRVLVDQPPTNTSMQHLLNIPLRTMNRAYNLCICMDSKS